MNTLIIKMLLKKYTKIFLKSNIKLEPFRVYLIGKTDWEIINKIFGDLYKQERI